MPAYVIVESDVTDPERYEQYKAATPAAIAAGGGRFLARGGELTVLEGDWQPSLQQHPLLCQIFHPAFWWTRP